MFYLLKMFVILCFFALTACNKNKTDEEMEELWSKAQTTGQIIERSGTVFNSATDKDLAMRDAETRLQTGGGLFGKKGMSLDAFGNKSDQNIQYGTIGMPINPYLWKASLETISFMPLASSDPFGGTIITDWYTSASNENERCKLNIFINGLELKTENLKVSSFCQIFKNQKWINTKINVQNNIKIENAILNKAKKIRVKAG